MICWIGDVEYWDVFVVLRGNVVFIRISMLWQVRPVAVVKWVWYYFYGYLTMKVHIGFKFAYVIIDSVTCILNRNSCCFEMVIILWGVRPHTC